MTRIRRDSVAAGLGEDGFALARSYVGEPTRQILEGDMDVLICCSTHDGYRFTDRWRYDVPGRAVSCRRGSRQEVLRGTRGSYLVLEAGDDHSV